MYDYRNVEIMSYNYSLAYGEVYALPAHLGELLQVELAIPIPDWNNRIN